MPHKSFIPDASPEKQEAVTFDVGGFRISNGEQWKETFTCVPVAPAGVLDDLATSSRVDGNGNRVYHSPSLLAFFEGVIVDTDVPRFREITHDKDRVVSIDQLGEVMMWLAEKLTDRPTQR